MFLTRRLRENGSAPKAKARRPGFPPRVEGLEDRAVPADVGDTLAVALPTALGPAAGTYTMPSQSVGDGHFGALDVDLYRIDATAGQVLKATTAAPGGNGNNTADTLL